MSWLARNRLLLVGLVVVALGIGLAALTSGRTPSDGTWDPDNPGSRGGQAVARVLADRGVDVQVVRSADGLEGVGIDADTTVVVTSTELLGKTSALRLAQASRYGHLILVEPTLSTTEALGIPTGTPVDLPEPVDADCTDVQLAGLRIDVETAVQYPSPQGCFGGEAGFVVGTPSAHLTLLGAGRILENDRILRGDNAAAALRLLGERDRLVWYVPTIDDLAAGEGSTLAALVPGWLKPGLWVVALATVGLLLWRGRRLGPLATEPLPVAIKAIETTQSRGRLYRKANDRGHAAAVLRTAARRRIAEHLHLPTSAADQPQLLLEAVMSHTGRPLEEVRDLLRPDADAPRTDKDLVTLATALAELDREVRRT
ncbi:MAG: DUF4350 domain-containing protein [Nocardioidaceae bacterium]